MPLTPDGLKLWERTLIGEEPAEQQLDSAPQLTTNPSNDALFRLHFKLKLLWLSNGGSWPTTGEVNKFKWKKGKKPRWAKAPVTRDPTNLATDIIAGATGTQLSFDAAGKLVLGQAAKLPSISPAQRFWLDFHASWYLVLTRQLRPGTPAETLEAIWTSVHDRWPQMSPRQELWWQYNYAELAALVGDEPAALTAIQRVIEIAPSVKDDRLQSVDIVAFLQATSTKVVFPLDGWNAPEVVGGIDFAKQPTVVPSSWGGTKNLIPYMSSGELSFAGEGPQSVRTLYSRRDRPIFMPLYDKPAFFQIVWRLLDGHFNSNTLEPGAFQTFLGYSGMVGQLEAMNTNPSYGKGQRVFVLARIDNISFDDASKTTAVSLSEIRGSTRWVHTGTTTTYDKQTVQDTTTTAGHDVNYYVGWSYVGTGHENGTTSTTTRDVYVPQTQETGYNEQLRTPTGSHVKFVKPGFDPALRRGQILYLTGTNAGGDPDPDSSGHYVTRLADPMWYTVEGAVAPANPTGRP